MVISCVIKFDHNPYGLYFAGQTISGQAEITLDKPKKVNGIGLKISGFAQCSWSETQTHGAGKHRRTHTVTYKGREDYLASKTYFVGSDEGNQLVLPVGLHTYNFSCVLPPMLPTSFEGTHGHIRYTVRVILERPWKFDQTYKAAFTVLKPYDLNYDSPLLRIPSQMEILKHFCCGPCRSAPLSIVASIPQSGYVPGQSVIVSVNILNRSNVPIDDIRYYLRRIVQYHSQTPAMKTKEEIVNIQQHRTGGMPRNDDGRYKVALLIPAVPPTNISLCKVVHITYDVKVEAKVSKMHANPCILIPITIGTVPLNENGGIAPVQPPINTHLLTLPITEQQTGYNPSAPHHSSPTEPFSANAGVFTVDNQAVSSVTGQHQYPDMPPPSYEESVLSGYAQIEDEEDQHPIGHQQFKPRYPVYHYNDNNAEVTNGQQIDAQTHAHATATDEATDGAASSSIDANLHSEKLRENIGNWN